MDWFDEETKQLAASGAKAHQRKDREDRTLGYKNWHRSLGPGLYVIDVDQVEYRIDRDGNVNIIALLELTRMDGNGSPSKSYLDSILQRFWARDAQARIITSIAEMLKVKAWIVLFREDLRQFSLYNISDNRGWYENLTAAKYAEWLRQDCGKGKEP